MGKSDEYQFDYLDDNGRFADQVNGALFQGRQVVRPEELEEADAQAVYLGKEAGIRRNFKTAADKVRIWRGKLLHILAVENQSHVDYHMVLRNMLSESLGYQKQWKRKKRKHEREKDLRMGSDAFLSGMEKDEKFIPIITLVVYCGTEHPWDGAGCLHDLLNVEEDLKEFITNYRLNLYDCQAHDTFDEYKTGLRQLFEVVRYGRDKENLRKILEENREAYSRIDSDTREMLEVVGKVRIGEEYEVMENGERRYDMCKAFLDMKQEGIEEGIEKGIEKERITHLIETVCKKLAKNKQAAVIAEELEEELQAVETVIKVQQQAGSYDVGRIYDILRKRQRGEVL